MAKPIVNKKEKITTKIPREWIEQETVKGQDWRLHAVTAVSRDSAIYKRGDVVKASMKLQISSALTLRAGAPNVEALLLDLSANLDGEAKALLDKAAPLGRGIVDVPDQVLFDILEKHMASAVFAFSSIESFANEVVSLAYSRGFKYEQKQRFGLIAVVALDDALWLQIDEKISNVLPAYLGIHRPKGKALWAEFKRLKKIEIALCM